MLTNLKRVGFNNNAFIIALYVSLSAFVSIWKNGLHFELTSFTNRVIGISTLSLTDVSARLTAFYNALYAGILSFVLVALAVNWVWQRCNKLHNEIKLINALSVVGTLLMLVKLSGQEIIHSLAFCNVCIGLVGVNAVLIKLFKPRQLKLTYYHYAILLTIIFSALAFIYLLTTPNITVNHLFLIVGLVVLILLFILNPDQGQIIGLFKWGMPVVVFPMLVTIGYEISLILNQRDVYANPYLLILLLCLLLTSLHYYIINKGARYNKQDAQQLFDSYFAPVFIITTIVVAGFTHLGVFSNEFFETANESNPLSEFFLFGQIPIIDTLNTHLVSDFYSPFIYSFLNGFDSQMSFRVYKCLVHIQGGIIFYFFLRLSFKNNLYVLLIVFFFPFLQNLYWGANGAVLLLIPIVLYKLYCEAGKAKYYWLFFIVLLIELAWRPDSGFMALVVAVTGLIAIIFAKREEIKWKSLVISAFSILSLPIVVLIFIELFTERDAFGNISQALSFFSSSPQARGYDRIAVNYDNIFYIHHFIYPFVAMVIGILLVFNFRKLMAKNSFLTMALLCLTVYYLSNIQRGLTRHTFYEGNSATIDSFIYLIFFMTVYLVSKKNYFRYILSVVLVLVVFIGFAYRSPKAHKNLSTAYIEKLNNAEGLKHSPDKIKRLTGLDTQNKINYKELKMFMDGELGDNETFFDFSNTPTLYYFLQRKQPVYFTHFLAVSKEKLQVSSVKRLKEFNVPFIVYGHVPESWWDKTDGLYNSVRFYRVAEHIFRNYVPYKNIGGFEVWKEKGRIVKNEYPEYSNVNFKSPTFNVGKLPYVWANYDTYELPIKPILLFENTTAENNVFNVEPYVNKDYGNYVDLIISNKGQNELKSRLNYYAGAKLLGSFEFDILSRQQTERYRFRISSQYNWYNNLVTRIEIETSGESVVDVLRVYSADY